MARLAVVLFNLGGPDSLNAVEPFLFNLFNDPAIIGLPAFPRRLLAWFISRRRGPEARQIYEKLGGKSPLLEETEAQADGLRRRLDDAGTISGTTSGTTETRVFVAMRYWHPLSDAAARDVKAFDPDEIVLLPLYPQFSTATTGSSLKEWRRAAAAAGLDAPTRAVCCYPTDPGLVRAQAALIAPAIAEAAAHGAPRVLFSAHGLPKKIVAAGDPYQWQIERTADAVAKALGLAADGWTVCYQSRVGPLEWIGPATDDEIRRAAADGVPAVVVPIAFVSEHSETLVELDMDYGGMAHELGIPAYVRVPTVSVQGDFIQGLADLVEAARRRPPGVAAAEGPRLCPGVHGNCPLGAAKGAPKDV